MRVSKETVNVPKGKLRIGKDPGVAGQNENQPMTPVDLEDWEEIRRRRRRVGRSRELGKANTYAAGTGGSNVHKPTNNPP